MFMSDQIGGNATALLSPARVGTNISNNNDLHSLAGAWILDVSRSDTMEGYLRCMMMPSVAIEAQLAGELAHQSRNVFALDDSLLLLHKKTHVNDFTETFELDQENVTRGSSGVKRTMASLLQRGRHDAIVVETLMPTHCHTFRLVEMRRVLGDGSTHTQDIHLQNLDTGAESTTRRTWIRVNMTQQDRQKLFED